LNGGLGNQLFQYSLGLYFQKKKNFTIKYEKSFFNKKTDVPVVRIDKVFDIKLDEIKKKNLDLRIKFFINRFTIYFFQTFSKKTLERFGIFIEKNTVYDNRILNAEKFLYFSGYFQSENYFKKIRKLIINKIKLKKKINKSNTLLLNKIRKTSSVAIHVRRNDYIKKPHLKKIYNICNKNYYMNAIRIVEKKIKNPKFFIFSDDILWVKKHFSYKKNIHIIESNQNEKDHVYDFELIKNCKHFVISNSSFSWWSCWLGSSNKSIVISPKKWFKDKNQRRNPLLESWIKI
tara:strand:- start:600 stop:1466 length:867 start_codon:yes stop_codon:yes gene_type:complete